MTYCMMYLEPTDFQRSQSYDVNFNPKVVFRASITNMSFSGNVGSVGNTLRIEVASNGALVIAINE